jgi:hypothetical protein
MDIATNEILFFTSFPPGVHLSRVNADRPAIVL